MAVKKKHAELLEWLRTTPHTPANRSEAVKRQAIESVARIDRIYHMEKMHRRLLWAKRLGILGFILLAFELGRYLEWRNGK